MMTWIKTTSDSYGLGACYLMNMLTKKSVCLKQFPNINWSRGKSLQESIDQWRTISKLYQPGEDHLEVLLTKGNPSKAQSLWVNSHQRSHQGKLPQGNLKANHSKSRLILISHVASLYHKAMHTFSCIGCSSKHESDIKNPCNIRSNIKAQFPSGKSFQSLVPVYKIIHKYQFPYGYLFWYQFPFDSQSFITSSRLVDYFKIQFPYDRLS